MKFLFICLILFSSINCNAQAYCALRDPVRRIKLLFPESDSFKSIVRKIDEDTRKATGDTLPFNLHHGELGRHTLYVALKKGKPLGYAHVRSEQTRWGLIEICWSLTLDNRIRGFSLQRCRIKAGYELEKSHFPARLKGHSVKSLKKLIRNGKVNLDSFKLKKEQQTIAASLIQSALKTMTVTAIVWKDDLKKYAGPDENK